MPDDVPRRTSLAVHTSAPGERANVMSTSLGRPITVVGGRWTHTLQQEYEGEDSGEYNGQKYAFDEEEDEK